MNCTCGRRLIVTETRDTGNIVWRTRKCIPCDWLYTTREEIVDERIPYTAHTPRKPKIKPKKDQTDEQQRE